MSEWIESPPELGPPLAGLRAAVRADAGARPFPALAEACRRAGRPDEAERVARSGLARRPDRIEAHVVLCLALLDQGRADEARRVLERVADDTLAAHGPLGDPGTVSDRELDRAFAAAETDPGEVLDADRVAQEALGEGDLALAEAFDPSAGSAFATATMAELLARQGDLESASRIRTALRDRDRPGGPAAGRAPEDPGEGLFPLDGPSRRRETLATLERWLENLRRPAR